MDDFKTFFLGLTREQRVEFAREANTSVAYIQTHLISKRKVPQPPLMNRLARACEKFGSGINREKLLAFFYDKAAA